jgi:hypothetical protein
MCKRAAAVLLVCAAFGAGPARAGTRLFFIELVGVGGYSTAAKKLIMYSISQAEAMQKPSLGFDLVQRFSGRKGDVAVLALQGRLAWNAETEEMGLKTVEPQLYNAYLKFKLGFADFWIGHDRPRLGLAMAIDNHAELLQPLSMYGFGFDRDWGIGLDRDTSWGTIGASLTAGSGMALRFKDSFFAAARISRGVLSQDNASGGFSLAYGKIQDVMGTILLSDARIELATASFDLSWVRNNWENRVEMLGGGRDGEGVFVLFWRTGLGLLEENRLKLEAQPLLKWADQKADLELGLGATYLLTADWTLRAMALYDGAADDFRFVVEVYFYKNLSR